MMKLSTFSVGVCVLYVNVCGMRHAAATILYLITQMHVMLALHCGTN